MTTRLKIYLASASADIPVIKPLLRELESMGHEISHDWTRSVEEAGSGSPDDGPIRMVAAARDLRAVRDADFVWLRAPAASSRSTGAWVELGMALGCGVPFVTSGDVKRCIFADFAAARFETDDEALAFFRKSATLAWEPRDVFDMSARPIVLEPGQSALAQFFFRHPMRVHEILAGRAQEVFAGATEIGQIRSPYVCLHVSDAKFGMPIHGKREFEPGALVPAGVGLDAVVRNDSKETLDVLLVMRGEVLKKKEARLT